MSRERMQEHFSDLYEGSIDPGLGQQILARMDADPELAADYAAFCDAMQNLDVLKDEVIEIPSNLSALIAERMEANQKRPALTLAGFWRNLAFGAVACAAIGGAFFAITSRGGNVSQGGGIATPTNIPVRKVETTNRTLDTIEIKMMPKGPTLAYEASGPKTVTVVNGDDQKLLKKFDLDGKVLSCPLENKGDVPSVMQIEATGEPGKHLVVIPGSGLDYEAAGQGDVVAFAKVLATKFRTTVHIQVPKEFTSNLKWDISQTTAMEAAKAVLNSSEFTISGDDKLLIVQKQNL